MPGKLHLFPTSKVRLASSSAFWNLSRYVRDLLPRTNSNAYSLQIYRKNQDDHNELIDKIGTIVTMMKDLALDPDSPPQSPKIKENLDQFRKYVLSCSSR